MLNVALLGYGRIGQMHAENLFNHMRSKDLNYNCAISNRNEITKLFYQKELSQLSTTERDQAETVFQGNIKEKVIQAFTLDIFKSKGFSQKTILLKKTDSSINFI